MALPKDYKVPASSGVDKYIQPSKLAQGNTKLRFMSNIITGYVYWEETKDGKRPLRVLTWKDIPSDVKARTENKPRHFWAAVVWNYQVEEAQIFEITQTTIQTILEGYENNEDYGDLKKYDITITVRGENRDRTYVVVASPPKPMDKGLEKYVSDLNINLDALYNGEDPFKSKGDEEVDVNEVLQDLDSELG